jgi:hypothetical protein
MGSEVTYEVGQRVEARLRGKTWVACEVIQLHPRFAGCARVKVPGHGSLRWFDAVDLRPIRTRAPLPIRTSEEADSWEEARERSTGTARAPIVEQPKRARPWRSESYLAHVRARGCCVPGCGSVSDMHAHHLFPEGRGVKCIDAFVANLCGECHGYLHQHGHLPAMDAVGSERVLWMACAVALAERVER